MTRLWEHIQNHKAGQKAIEAAGGIAIMLIASIFSPTYWLMTLVLKPYFDLKGLFTDSNFIVSYFELIHTMKVLGPEVLLLKIVPMLLLCLLAGLTYSAFCTWAGLKLTKHFIQRVQYKTV